MERHSPGYKARMEAAKTEVERGIAELEGIIDVWDERDKKTRRERAERDHIEVWRENLNEWYEAPPVTRQAAEDMEAFMVSAAAERAKKRRERLYHPLNQHSVTARARAIASFIRKDPGRTNESLAEVTFLTVPSVAIIRHEIIQREIVFPSQRQAPQPETFLINQATGQRRRVISIDREAGKIILLHPKKGEVEARFDEVALEVQGWRIVQNEVA